MINPRWSADPVPTDEPRDYRTIRNTDEPRVQPTPTKQASLADILKLAHEGITAQVEVIAALNEINTRLFGKHEHLAACAPPALMDSEGIVGEVIATLNCFNANAETINAGLSRLYRL